MTRRAGPPQPAAALVLVAAFAGLSCATESDPSPVVVAAVEISPSPGSVLVGASLQLSAVTKDPQGGIISGRTIVWSSGSPSVATVSSDGLITGVSVGITTITATSEGKRGTVEVTVVPVPVATVELTPTTGTLVEGRTLQLAATLKTASGQILLDRTVRWSSVPSSVALVSQDGLVTANTAGSATVTATSEGKEASATITVTPALVATIELTPTSSALGVGTTLQLGITLRDSIGRQLTNRPVSWSSNNTTAATVSALGTVTGVADGPAVITARSDGVSATVRVRVFARSSLDRPDQVTGPQVHVLYVVPSDGEDRQLDLDGTLQRSVASFHAWFNQRSNGLAFLFDTIDGFLDITFLRLSQTDAELIASGVIYGIRQELEAVGRLRSDKLYLVYHDGGSLYSCGNAEWPGQLAIMYLRGNAGGISCASQQFVSSPTEFPRYWEFAMLHDLVHTLGVVAPNAPHHATAYPAHVPEPEDLMYSGPAPWAIGSGIVIDVGGDDYFGPLVPSGVRKITDSPFIARLNLATLPLEPQAVFAARDLAEALSMLPPHPPFPNHPVGWPSDATTR